MFSNLIFSNFTQNLNSQTSYYESTIYINRIILILKIIHSPQIFTKLLIAPRNGKEVPVHLNPSDKSWIRTFNDDPKVLVLAAAQAQNAVNYILNQKSEPSPTGAAE